MVGIIKYFENELGWADIECLLSYEKFDLIDLEKIINHALTLGLVLEEGKHSKIPERSAFSAFTMSDELIQPPVNTPIGEFIIKISNEQCNVVNINTRGILYDVDTEIVFSFFVARRVLIIYCIESFIWGYGDDVKKSDVRRLQAFYKICKSVCDILPPKYGYVGPEEIHAMDIQIEHANENDFEPYDPKIFSHESAQELVDWYKVHKDFTF